jgi:hypothetical protein
MEMSEAKTAADAGGEKLRNEATSFFVFSENMKKGVHGRLLSTRSRSRFSPGSHC